MTFGQAAITNSWLYDAMVWKDRYLEAYMRGDKEMARFYYDKYLEAKERYAKMKRGAI